MKKIMLADCQLTVANVVLKNITLTACTITRALAADDHGHITLLSATLRIEDLLQHAITVTLAETILFKGLITRVDQSRLLDTTCFSLRLHSTLYPLKQKRHRRIFTEKTAKEILSAVLAPYHFPITFSLSEKALVYPLMTQYHQSDFDFLKSVAAKHGLFFYFHQDSWVITDHYPEAKPITLTYKSLAGLQNTAPCVFELKRTKTLCSQTIRLQDYNPLTAASQLRSSDRDPAQTFGTWLHFDTQAQNAVMQRQLLKHLRQSQQTEVITLRSNDMSLDLNQLLTVSDHPGLSVDDYYRVTQVSHHFDTGYYNECHLLPAAHCFRTQAPMKTYVGLQTATVFAHETTTPNLNDQGHYQLQMPYQDTPIDAHLVRKLVQLTGTHQGQHFPLHDQTTVLLAYINGELNEPVIIGSLSSDKNPDLVTCNNSAQHLIRTHTQQELCFDDAPDNPQVHLNNQQQQLILNQSPPHLSLNSQDGELQIIAESSIHYHSDGNFQQSIQGHSKTIVKAYYQLQATTITLENQQDSIQLNIKQNAQFSSQNSHLLQKLETQHIQTPRLKCQSTVFENHSKGSHDSTAQSITLTADDTLELCCGESQLTLDPFGNLKIHSKAVEFHCESLSNTASKIDMDKN